MARRAPKRAPSAATCSPEADRRLTKSRVYAAGELFHVMVRPARQKVASRLLLRPGVPKDPMPGEDTTIGRVCLAHTPGEALAAIEAWDGRFGDRFGSGGKVVHIYANESPVEVRIPPRSLLPDALATGEVWCRCPVPAVLIGTIGTHEVDNLLHETSDMWRELNIEERLTITKAKPSLGTFMDYEASCHGEMGIMGWLATKQPTTAVEAAVVGKAEAMLSGMPVVRPPVSGTPLQCNPSGNAHTEFYRLLASNGAVLLRKKKHMVFALPNGQRVVAPKTASDWRSWKNALAHLKRLLADMEAKGREVRWNPVPQFEEFWSELPPALRAELGRLPLHDPRRRQRYWQWINERSLRRQGEQGQLFGEPPHDFPPPRPPLAEHNPRVAGTPRMDKRAREAPCACARCKCSYMVPSARSPICGGCLSGCHDFVGGCSKPGCTWCSDFDPDETMGKNPPRGDARTRDLVRQALATDAIPDRAAADHALERTPLGHFVEERVALRLPVRVRQIRFGSREGLVSQIEREGEAVLSHEDLPPVGPPFDLWQLAQRKLEEWGLHAPSGGGYHKTDFVIEWEDGDTYDGRFDLVYGGTDDSGRTLRDHVKGYLLFRSGMQRPAWTLEDRALRDGTWERMRARDEESGASAEALRMLRRYFPDARQPDGVPRSL